MVLTYGAEMMSASAGTAGINRPLNIATGSILSATWELDTDYIRSVVVRPSIEYVFRICPLNGAIAASKLSGTILVRLGGASMKVVRGSQS